MMENNVTIDKSTRIRVNVPETSGFYRLNAAAFFTVNNAVFKRMMKALKADAENAEKNARILFDFAHFMESENPRFFTENAERIAEINSVWNAGAECFQVSADEKKAVKAFTACAAGKKDSRPLLRKPFENRGRIYCTNSFMAARYDGAPETFKGNYISENIETDPETGTRYGSARPNMEKLFPDLETVKAEYNSVSIPDINILKQWAKTRKNADPAVFVADSGAVYEVNYIYKAAALTLSSTLYFSGINKPAYMTGNGYTVIICGMYVSPSKCLNLYNAITSTTAPALVKVSFDTYGQKVVETMPILQETENTPETPENNVSADLVSSVKKIIEKAVSDSMKENGKKDSAGAPTGKECENDSTGAADPDSVESENNVSGNAVSDIPSDTPEKPETMPADICSGNNVSASETSGNAVSAAETETAGNTVSRNAAADLASDSMPETVTPAADPDETAEKLYIIAGVELEKNRIETIISNNEYLVKSRTVYKIERTRRGYIAINVYQKKTGVPIIGGACRFTTMEPERLEKMFPDFAEKVFKPAPAAAADLGSGATDENSAAGIQETGRPDSGKLEKDPERMPETETENAAAVMPAKTAVNDAETVRRYNYHGNAKHAGNGAKTAGKQAAALYNLRTDETRIPALVIIPTFFTSGNCELSANLHKSPERVPFTGYAAGIHPDEISFCGFLRSSATVCAGENAFCDILSGVPPGPPGMRVSSSWKHPCSA